VESYASIANRSLRLRRLFAFLVGFGLLLVASWPAAATDVTGTWEFRSYSPKKMMLLGAPMPMAQLVAHLTFATDGTTSGYGIFEDGAQCWFESGKWSLDTRRGQLVANMTLKGDDGSAEVVLTAKVQSSGKFSGQMKYTEINGIQLPLAEPVYDPVFGYFSDLPPLKFKGQRLTQQPDLAGDYAIMRDNAQVGTMTLTPSSKVPNGYDLSGQAQDFPYGACTLKGGAIVYGKACFVAWLEVYYSAQSEELNYPEENALVGKYSAGQEQLKLTLKYDGCCESQRLVLVKTSVSQ
jgi:hypothetical protein